MKNMKGFTLIEVLISISLLTIIALGMMSAMTSQFELLKRTQNVTVDVALVQQQMELEIEEVQQMIRDDITPTGIASYTLFEGTSERTVDGYARDFEIKVGSEFRTLSTVIADVRMPEFPVPSASVSIDFFDGGSVLPHAYRDTPSLRINTDLSISDPDNVYLTSIYRWYVTRPGFNIPMILSPEEIEIGTLYPRFPDDYTIILGESDKNLTAITSAFMGKHLVCSVTPAARSGKMGSEAVSNPVFLSGLPVINDLRLHLDASMISKEDSSAVREDSDQLYVENWYDISGRDATASQGSNSLQPELMEIKIGELVENEILYETFVKYAAFDGAGDGMISFTGSLGADITLFAVLRNFGDEQFSLYHLDTLPESIVLNPNSVQIGYTPDRVDVAEIIVYDDILPQPDIDAIDDYLRNKYTPEEPDVTIYKLNDLDPVEVFMGTVYDLPSTVSANMTNGRVEDVEVTWSPDPIDTSTLGVKYSTASAVADPSKTTNLQVTVIEAESVTGVTLNKETTTIEKGNSETLVATVEPPDAANKDIIWSSSNSTIATVDSNGVVTAGLDSGIATITVTTVDGGFTDTCEVTVPVVNVTGVTLNKNSTTLNAGGTETLIATVEPLTADTKDVTWVSDDTNIATVDSNGLVTAGSSAGNATITVTTVDGGFTDTCVVTVVTDTTPPTVATLGVWYQDYRINNGSSSNLVFSEALSASSKAAVEAALTAGCNRTLSYSWAGNVLTMTNNSGSQARFNNDVYADLTDLAGNTNANAKLIESAPW